MKLKTGIVIQARMSSTRLPGKVLKPLGDQAMLWHVVKRSQASQKADMVIVATTTDPSDDGLVKFCQEQNFPVSRGSLEDVLARYRDAAQQFALDTVVRVTSDCPLVDPAIIDESIELLGANQDCGVVYVSSVLDRIFPRGPDCETFTAEALAEANEKATTDEEREHVTVYIRKYLKTLPHRVTLEYRGNFRLTVDEPADYELMKKIYDQFYRPGEIIDVREVIKYLQAHPEIASLNAQVEQKKVSA